MSRRMRLRRNGRTSVVNVSNSYSSAYPYPFHGYYIGVDPAGCEFVEEVTDANATVSTDVPVSDFGNTSGSYGSSDYGHTTTEQQSSQGGYSQPETSYTPPASDPTPQTYSPPPSYDSPSGGYGGGGYDG